MANYPARKLLIGIILVVSAYQSHAQKKVVPVVKSALTGMPLPAGTRQDSRLMTELAAKTFFDLETKKAGTTVSKVEVLTLPVSSGYSADSLAANLARLGYTQRTMETDNKSAWLQKDARHLVVYFDTSKAGFQLYFGELKAAPQAVVATNTKSGNTQPSQTPQQTGITGNTQVPANTGYAFTTTNFDDGWNSTVREDWVEVTKGSIKVLLHYPNEKTIIAADPEPVTSNAWNILVAPRYSNLTNYRTAYIRTFNMPYLGMGTLTDNASGRKVFVVLFRQGQSAWIEFVTPDKNTFIQQFGFDPELIQWDSESDLMKSLIVMNNYNKFAVAMSDFTGAWTSDFTGMQQLYHVYTGNYAGMYVNQSSETFNFSGNGGYHWKLLVVNGMVGSMKATQVEASGQMKVLNNWQISCTDKEGKTKKYHAFFSCIKGARLLNLLDADAPGSGLYTIFGRK